MIATTAVLALAVGGFQSVSAEAKDYGELHYLFAGAIGDQSCADRRSNELLKRRFNVRYGDRVRQADRWFETRYSRTVLAASLEEAYGGPGSIDARDCMMKPDGTPAFRDTERFVAKLRSIERDMRDTN